MSYIPTIWETGDEITTSLINKMEYGLTSNDLFIIESTINNNNNKIILSTPVEDILNIINNDLIIVYQIMYNNTFISIEIVDQLEEQDNSIVINSVEYDKTTGIAEVKT